MKKLIERTKNGHIWKLEDETYEAVELVSGLRIKKIFENVNIAKAWLSGDDDSKKLNNYQTADEEKEVMQVVKEKLNLNSLSDSKMDEILRTRKITLTASTHYTGIETLGVEFTVHRIMSLSLEKGSCYMIGYNTFITIEEYDVMDKVIKDTKANEFISAKELLKVINTGFYLKYTNNMGSIFNEQVLRGIYNEYKNENKYAILEEPVNVIEVIKDRGGITLGLNKAFNLVEQRLNKGFMVSVSGKELQVEEASFYANIDNILGAYLDEFEIKDGYVGVWVNNGIVYIDNSFNIDNLNDAVVFGKKHNQLSIYDCENNDVIDL